MKYDITFPAAEAMIAQERLAAAEATAIDYSKSVAVQVNDRELRAYWCESYQSRIDEIIALLDEQSNVPGWQDFALREARLQLKARNTRREKAVLIPASK